MKKIAFVIFLSALLLLAPQHLQQHGLWYSDDDWDYFAHASAIAFGQFPSYEKEFFRSGNTPLGSIGPGLLAAPFVFGFSLIDRWEGAEIVAQRTQANIYKSWAHIGFVVASNVYFILGCWLLFKGLNLFYSERASSWSIIFMVICQGIPLFVYRRPIFSHAYEFFLQSVLVYGLCLKGAGRITFQRLSVRVCLGFVIGLIYLVRFNNVFTALLWPLVLCADRMAHLKQASFWKKVLPVYATALGLILIFKVWPNLGNDDIGYGGGHMARLLKIEPLRFYGRRVWHILWGMDWGMVYTMPFVFLGLATLIMKPLALRRSLLIMLSVLIVNFYILIMWRTQGGWYGYRYIMGPLYPLLVYPLAALIEQLDQKSGRRGWFLLCLLAVFPVLSMISFEGTQLLNLTNYEQYFNDRGWGNNYYQFEVWKMVLFKPLDWFLVIYKRGIMYLVYLIMIALQHMRVIEEVYIREYHYFDHKVMIKIFILYSLPFFFLLIHYGSSASIKLNREGHNK